MLKLCLFENKLNLCSTLYFLSASKRSHTPYMIPEISTFRSHSHSLFDTLQPAFQSRVSTQATLASVSSNLCVAKSSGHFPPARPHGNSQRLGSVLCFEHSVLGCCEASTPDVPPLSIPSSSPLMGSPSFACHWRLEFFHAQPPSVTLN